jgi:hypothetical protein
MQTDQMVSVAFDFRRGAFCVVAGRFPFRVMDGTVDPLGG